MSINMAPRWIEEVCARLAASGMAPPGLGEKPSSRSSQPCVERRSAVLMLLAGESFHSASILLTHRSPFMRSHAGQIAFPGGRVDPEDRDAADTALREAWEETGVDRAGITPLLTLPDAHTYRGAAVSPVLAWWHRPGPVWAASPAEVDDVFQVPLTELCDPNNRIMVGLEHPLSRKPWRGPAFWVRDYLVWGFTGGLLAGFLRATGQESQWDCNTTHDLATMIQQSRNNEESAHRSQHRKNT